MIRQGIKRVAGNLLLSYPVTGERTSYSIDPPQNRPTNHEIGQWLLKGLYYTDSHIHVHWEWTVVE